VAWRWEGLSDMVALFNRAWLPWVKPLWLTGIEVWHSLGKEEADTGNESPGGG